MPNIQGFVSKADFTNNTPGKVSEFFELSPLAETYSRVTGMYQSSDFVGDVLTTFTAADDKGVPYALDPVQVKEILGVTKGLYSYIQNTVFPYNTSDYRNSIAVMFKDQIENFVLGPIYVGSTINFPEWVTWDSLQFQGTQIKIWFVNDSFENQYSNYEIVVIPPVTVLDNLFGNYGSMVTQLQAITPGDFNDRVQDARNGIPETVTRYFSFGYVNPNNPTQHVNTTWAALVYGRNGDNIDSIKDAIVNYVLSNSSHNQQDWQVIFPDIFRRTEFLIYPRWDLISIPNLTNLAALYSSIADPVESITFAKSKWWNIDPAWVGANLAILPIDYKAISILSLTGANNQPGYESLKKLFPDYIPVNTSSPDFNRMTESTRNWAAMMVGLLKTAESVNENSSILNPMRRVVRDKVTYITQLYQNVNYLVAARMNP